MSNNKTKIVSKTKPSFANNAWAYISIAGALVAMVYAGLSLQDQGEFSSQSPETTIEAPLAAPDSAAKEVDATLFNNQQDPSH